MSKSSSKMEQLAVKLAEDGRLSEANKFIKGSADMNAALIGYPALLTSAILRAVGGSSKLKLILVILSFKLKQKTGKSFPIRLNGLVALGNRLKTLYSHLSDIRTFIRLWGSLDYAEWAVSSLNNKNPDNVLRYVDYGQIVACMLYQILENIAYVGSHGIISMSTPVENRLWSVSCIMWAIHVQLDFVKFIRERQLRKKLEAEQGEKADLAAIKLADKEWLRTFLINCCYTPLSIHWSFETGFLPDFLVGAFGTFAVVNKAVPKWRTLLGCK